MTALTIPASVLLPLMPDELSIEGPRSVTQDAEGAETVTFPDERYSGVPCQVSPHGDQTEIGTGEGEFISTTVIVYALGDLAGTSEGDQATIGSESFDIIGVQHDSFDVVTTLLLRRRVPS